MNVYIQYLSELIPEKDSLKIVRAEAEKYYKSHSIDECYDITIELYQSENFQIQEIGVLLLGYVAHQKPEAMGFGKAGSCRILSISLHRNLPAVNP